MPNNYIFLDADASILTARSSITSGTAHEPIVTIGSFLSAVPTTPSGNQSVSGTINIGNAPSIYGNISGSVVAFQGTNPWVMGSVLANVGGSVLSYQAGTQISSVVSSIPSSLLTGIHGHRNDAIASFLGGNLSWNPLATDSAGRVITKPFTPDDGTLIEYQGSVVSTSVTLIRASAIGLRNYVTDFFVANTGSVATLITFQDGSTSVLAKTIAPGTGG